MSSCQQVDNSFHSLAGRCSSLGAHFPPFRAVSLLWFEWDVGAKMGFWQAPFTDYDRSGITAHCGGMGTEMKYSFFSLRDFFKAGNPKIDKTENASAWKGLWEKCETGRGSNFKKTRFRFFATESKISNWSANFMVRLCQWPHYFFFQRYSMWIDQIPLECWLAIPNKPQFIFWASELEWMHALKITRRNCGHTIFGTYFDPRTRAGHSVTR